MVYSIEPVADARWAAFVESHPDSSVFHSVAWLDALQRTYAYRPVVYTTSPPEVPLRDGLPVCFVASWITGRRLVSLPFSDHCELLAENTDRLLSALAQNVKAKRLRYLEVRPTRSLGAAGGLYPTASYCLHQLDLGPNVGTLFDNCHKSSTQR